MTQVKLRSGEIVYVDLTPNQVGFKLHSPGSIKGFADSEMSKPIRISVNAIDYVIESDAYDIQ